MDPSATQRLTNESTVLALGESGGGYGHAYMRSDWTNTRVRILLRPAAVSITAMEDSTDFADVDCATWENGLSVEAAENVQEFPVTQAGRSHNRANAGPAWTPQTITRESTLWELECWILQDQEHGRQPSTRPRWLSNAHHKWGDIAGSAVLTLPVRPA